MLVLAVLVAFVNLGFWQLRRLDERHDRNELVETRLAEAPVAVEELGAPGEPGADALDAVRFRPVTATGAYVEPTVAVRTTQGGLAGGWVFTPLALDGGTHVWVLRGFAGLGPDGDVEAPPVPLGEQRVRGVAVPLERLPRVARRGIEQAEAPPATLPFALQATGGEDGLEAVPLPSLDDGPHLSYAVQWFLFAGVVAVGYPIVLRRRG